MLRVMLPPLSRSSQRLTKKSDKKCIPYFDLFSPHLWDRIF